MPWGLLKLSRLTSVRIIPRHASGIVKQIAKVRPPYLVSMWLTIRGWIPSNNRYQNPTDKFIPCCCLIAMQTIGTVLRENFSASDAFFQGSHPFAKQPSHSFRFWFCHGREYNRNLGRSPIWQTILSHQIHPLEEMHYFLWLDYHPNRFCRRHFPYICPRNNSFCMYPFDYPYCFHQPNKSVFHRTTVNSVSIPVMVTNMVHIGPICIKTGIAGFEPTTCRLTADCTTNCAISQIIGQRPIIF